MLIWAWHQYAWHYTRMSWNMHPQGNFKQPERVPDAMWRIKMRYPNVWIVGSKLKISYKIL